MEERSSSNLRLLASIWHRRASGVLMFRLKSSRIRAVAFSRGGPVDVIQFSTLNAYLRTNEAFFRDTEVARRRGDRAALARFLCRQARKSDGQLIADRPVRLDVADEDVLTLGLSVPHPDRLAIDLEADQEDSARVLLILGLAGQPSLVQPVSDVVRRMRQHALDRMDVYSEPPPVRRAPALA